MLKIHCVRLFLMNEFCIVVLSRPVSKAFPYFLLKAPQFIPHLMFFNTKQGIDGDDVVIPYSYVILLF